MAWIQPKPAKVNRKLLSKKKKDIRLNAVNLPTIQRISNIESPHAIKNEENQVDAWIKSSFGGPSVYINRKSGYSVWDAIPEGHEEDEDSNFPRIKSYSELDSALASDIKDHNKANLALNEILDIEAIFNEHMDNLVNVYISKMWNSIDTIPQLKDPRILMFFEASNTVRSVHRAFYDEMLQVDSASEELPVEDRIVAYVNLFQDYVQSLRIHGDYAAVCGTALESFTRLAEENAEFSSLLRRCKAYPVCKSHPLNSLMMMPPQRCTRHVLLLQQLLSKIAKSTPMYTLVEGTIKAYEQLATYVNERIRERENRELVAVAESFISTGSVPSLVTFGREIIHEGGLGRIWKRGGIQTCYFILCNDILIRSTVKLSGKHVLSKVFPLDEMVVKKDPVIETDFFIDQENLIDLTEMLIEISTPKKSFLVIASSIEERDIWLEKLCNTIFQHRKGGTMDSNFKRSSNIWNVPFIDQNDGDRIQWSLNISHCSLCDSKFTIFLRKLYCRRCAKPICSNCSKHTLTHPQMRKKIRVCRECEEQGGSAIELDSLQFSKEHGRMRKLEQAMRCLFDRNMPSSQSPWERILVYEDSYLFCLEHAISSFLLSAYSSVISKSSIERMQRIRSHWKSVDPFCAAVVNSFINLFTVQKAYVCELRKAILNGTDCDSVALRFAQMAPLFESHQDVVMRMVCNGSSSQLAHLFKGCKLDEIGISVEAVIRWPLIKLLMTLQNLEAFQSKSVKLERAIDVLRSSVDQNRRKLRDCFVGSAVHFIEKCFLTPFKLPSRHLKTRSFLNQGFVRAQVFYVVSVASQEGSHEFYFHLFSDALILSSPRLFPGGFSQKIYLNLEDYRLTQNTWSKARGNDVSGSLLLSSRSNMITLLFSSEEELVTWQLHLKMSTIKI